MTPTRVIRDVSTPAHTVALEGGLSASLAIGIGLVLAIEGAVVHLWVAERSQALAWVISSVNVVTLAWLWREHASSRRGRLVVRDGGVEIDAASRLRCRFPISAIASVDIATWRSVPDMAADFVNTAKPLEPNVVVVLREPVDGRLALGARKRVTRIGIRVNDASGVIGALSGRG